MNERPMPRAFAGNEPAKLTTVTLTGADERTDIVRLVQLVAAHPYLEIGLLYTATPEGRNRYPAMDWLLKASSALASACAIHVCGRRAREQLREGALADLVGNARRVQVNGIVHHDEALHLARRVPVLITQYNAGNSDTHYTSAANHQWLVDSSGGTGRSPERWERPAIPCCVGFAGGLGPDNIATELPKIAAVAEGNYWVDMEGKLRTQDWFDLALCDHVLGEVGKSLPALS